MSTDTQQNKKNHKKDIKNRKNIGFCYSFLTIVLIFCLIQIGYGAILNISKIVAYQGKRITLENLLKQTKLRNQDLQFERKMITQDNSLEGIARNNLKMAKEDEVLIIINKKVETPKKEETFLSKLNINLFKKDEKSKNSAHIIPKAPETMEEE